MVWVVRTYEKNVTSGFHRGGIGVPKDKYFTSKTLALKYRSKLNRYSELFQIEPKESEKGD